MLTDAHVNASKGMLATRLGLARASEVAKVIASALRSIDFSRTKRMFKMSGHAGGRLKDVLERLSMHGLMDNEIAVDTI